MHFSKISLAVAASQLLALTSGQYHYYGDSFPSLYARDAEAYDEMIEYLEAREADPFADEEYAFDLYSREAEAEPEDDYGFYKELYARTGDNPFEGVRVPGGPVGKGWNVVKQVFKANDALQRKREKDTKRTGTFNEKFGGSQFLNPGLGRSKTAPPLGGSSFNAKQPNADFSRLTELSKGKGKGKGKSGGSSGGILGQLGGGSGSEGTEQ